MVGERCNCGRMVRETDIPALSLGEKASRESLEVGKDKEWILP